MNSTQRSTPARPNGDALAEVSRMFSSRDERVYFDGHNQERNPERVEANLHRPGVPSSASAVVKELTRAFKIATVLISIAECGLHRDLISGYAISNAERPTTGDRAVLSAAALGLVRRAPDDRWLWVDGYSELAQDEKEWRRAIDVFLAQQSYVRLARSVNSTEGWTFSPSEQLRRSMDEYLHFLGGVDATQQENARYFVQLAQLREARQLVDLGGGLGTYSRAWVESDGQRQATVVDLPAVGSAYTGGGPWGERLCFRGGDLMQLPEDALTGDVYLFSNVLHLLPQWAEVVSRVAAGAHRGAWIVVIEASADGEAGVLFDFQVHLRSGGVGGLLPPAQVSSLFASLLENTAVYELNHPEDPYERQYRIWLGQKAR